MRVGSREQAGAAGPSSKKRRAEATGREERRGEASHEEGAEATAPQVSGGDGGIDQPALLRQWYWSCDEKLCGRVFGKAGYRDGTLITTSAVRREQRFSTYAVTESGG